MSRIETREHALELLFQMGFREDSISEQINLFKANCPDEIEEEYFLDIVYGVINSREELDEKFVPFLKKWKLERDRRAYLEIVPHQGYEKEFYRRSVHSVLLHRDRQ